MATEALLAFLLAEEEDAEDRTRAALRSLRRSSETSSRSLQSSRSPVEDAAYSTSVKTESPATKRHKIGGRCAADYLLKGGMMAFYNLNDFHTHFGMTRTQVEDLLNQLQPHYPYERGSKLPLENVVLASLWVLSSQESYRVIAERFQTSKSVICTSLHTFCNLVSGNLENHIRWPVGAAVKRTVHGFEALGFPGTLGALGAFQITINKPKDVQEPNEYQKETAVYSTTLLAVCDNKYKFTYVNVGHPGAFNDSEVFRRCELYEAFQEDPHSLLPCDFHIGDQTYTYHILGDARFPLSEYVMTPYQGHHHLNAKEEEYNKRHLSALWTISKAVGILKGRFNRLKSLPMQHLAQCSVAIKACCILHNICFQTSDVDIYSAQEIPPPLTTISCIGFESSVTGENKRNAIADSFSSEQFSR